MLVTFVKTVRRATKMHLEPNKYSKLLVIWKINMNKTPSKSALKDFIK